jgi:ArsR family transcriptional regulator
MCQCEYTPRVHPTRTRASCGLRPEELLAACGEPTRLRLLALLEAGETCVCDLVGTLELPQPTVSRHLAVLRRAGLVVARRHGTWMWYSLAPAGSRVHAKLLECLAACHEEQPELAADARRCATLRNGRRCC